MIRAGVIAMWLVTIAQPAFPQLTDFLTSPGYSALINNSINNKIFEGYYTGGTRRSSGTSRTARSSQASSVEVPEYRRYPTVQFKPTGTRVTLKEYLDSVNIGSKEKADLKALVLTIFDSYEAEAKRKGYPNDLALALVSCIGLNYHVHSGKTGKLLLPFEQNLGQRDAIAEYATDNRTFAKLSDLQKQELYELFIILGGLTYHYYDKAQKENNTAEIKNTREMAMQNLKLLGVR
jgi:hypothetical protein